MSAEEVFLNQLEDNGAGEIYDFADKPALVEAMNKKTAIVSRGNKIQFVLRKADGAISFLSRHDAADWFAPYQLVVTRNAGTEKERTEELAGFLTWRKSPERKTYNRVVFDPSRTEAECDKCGELNLFGGWGVTPKAGGWSLLRAHLFENICQGNQEIFDYLMMWLSQMFYEPGRKSGVCIVFRGPEGVGKSKLGEWLRVLVGKRHSATVHNTDNVVGKFNSLIENKILVLIEESPVTGDNRNTFAHLITNHDVSVERKGVDAEDGENYSRFMIFLNGQWAVPVLQGDRRYFVLDVGDKRKEDKEYFAAIDAEMAAGGAEAMLAELLGMKAKMRTMPKPPMTDAKREQIELGMGADVLWWADVLREGRFRFADGKRDAISWKDEGAVAKDAVADSYRDALPGRTKSPNIAVGRFLEKWLPGVETKRGTGDGGEREYQYVLPALAVAQAAFLSVHPGFKFQDEVPEAEVEVAAPPTPSPPVSFVEERAKRRSRF